MGSTIATASASDADGDSLTYSLTVDQSGKLSIDQNGAITLASAFDNVVAQFHHNVILRATDGTDDAKADFVLTVTADGSITIHENVLDFEDVHSSNDGTEIAYKLDIGYYTMNLGQGDTTNQARIVRQSGHNYHSLTNVPISICKAKTSTTTTEVTRLGAPNGEQALVRQVTVRQVIPTVPHGVGLTMVVYF